MLYNILYMCKRMMGFLIYNRIIIMFVWNNHIHNREIKTQYLHSFLAPSLTSFLPLSLFSFLFAFLPYSPSFLPPSLFLSLCTFHSPSLQNSEFLCHNYIRVYHRFPGNSSRLFVCGTQAKVEPECRVLEVRVGEC